MFVAFSLFSFGNLVHGLVVHTCISGWLSLSVSAQERRVSNCPSDVLEAYARSLCSKSNMTVDSFLFRSKARIASKISEIF